MREEEEDVRIVDNQGQLTWKENEMDGKLFLKVINRLTGQKYMKNGKDLEMTQNEKICRLDVEIAMGKTTNGKCNRRRLNISRNNKSWRTCSEREI
jgi:serine protease inhibitor ecotin